MCEKKDKRSLIGMSILVVDDTPDALLTYSGIVSDAGAVVTKASDIDEALEFQRNKKFDLIITDGLDGEWDRIAENSECEVIVLSGDNEILKAAKNAGYKVVEKRATVSVNDF